MTQALVSPFQVYVGDGTVVAFSYDFCVGVASELEVYVDGVLVTGYTVSGLGNPTGGTVTFLSAPVAASVILLRRTTEQTQLVDYIDNNEFGAQVHEGALDKLTRLIQDLGETLGRVPQLAVTTLATLRNLVLPPPGGGKVLGWNSQGTALQLYDLPLPLAVTTGRVFGTSTATVPAVAGASRLTAPGLLPAGSRVSAVVYRCTTSFGVSNGLTSLDVGEAGVQDRWGTQVALIAGTLTGYGSGVPGHLDVASATDVVLTANGGTFDAQGACTLKAYWEQLLV